MAGAYSLQEIIGFAPLTESLKLVGSGVPNPFPKEFLAVRPGNKIIGDRAKYITTTGERRTSYFTQYGAVGIRRALRDVGDAAVRLLHTHETTPIELVQMENLRSFESYTQDQGMDWLNYQIEEAGHRAMNTRIMMNSSTLRYGKIYIDGSGNLLPTSSGAVTTVDFNIPAANQNQINSIIDASWALPSTNIPLHIKNLKVYQRQLTGMELETVLYGKNVTTYLAQNLFVIDFLARQDEMRGQLLRENTIPSGLFGIKNWIPVDTSFFEDQNGVVQEMWDADLAVFMPDIKQAEDRMSWWEAWEGSYPVPTRLDIQSNLAANYANFKRVFGMASYAFPRVDGVPAYELNFVDTFLAGPRNNKALFQATVAF